MINTIDKLGKFIDNEKVMGSRRSIIYKGV